MKLLASIVLVAVVGSMGRTASAQSVAKTPIQHLVVIFDENNSFDHYFGTYPNASNPPGEPRFVPARGTPRVDGLSDALLSNNAYAAEQAAFDRGLMDRSPESTSAAATLRTRMRLAVPTESLWATTTATHITLSRTRRR
ncbi:MAG: hypothetical protein JO020_18030 [Chloroflexi bacterium]|nr:hypothetical protein [Chloroflexota bacterium]